MIDHTFKLWIKSGEKFSMSAGNPIPGYCISTDGSLWHNAISENINPCDSECRALQHIGFSDKLGQPIYEGDILEMAGGGPRIIVEDIYSFLIYCGKYQAEHHVELFPCVTVIGNKYEDDGLL